MPEIDLRPVVVRGRNQLVVDIVTEMVAGLSPGPPVLLLVDPEPTHWADARDRQVVAVLSEPTDADVLTAVRRGANAVVGAGEALAELATAVETVRAGGALLSPAHARLVVDTLRAPSDGERITLTRRENDIINSINAGDSVKQTAIRLGIAQKTVENLQLRLFRKLGVRYRAQAVARAHHLGLLDDALPADSTSGTLG